MTSLRQLSLHTAAPPFSPRARARNAQFQRKLAAVGTSPHSYARSLGPVQPLRAALLPTTSATTRHSSSRWASMASQLLCSCRWCGFLQNHQSRESNFQIKSFAFSHNDKYKIMCITPALIELCSCCTVIVNTIFSKHWI